MAKGFRSRAQREEGDSLFLFDSYLAQSVKAFPDSAKERSLDPKTSCGLDSSFYPD